MRGVEQVHRALNQQDPALLRATLEENGDLRERINEPLGPFDSPLILAVRSREMLDVVLEFAADINARSHWWAGGFGLLDFANNDLADYAISRGARLDVHSAARLGRLDELRAFLPADPTLVHARGGDGKTPLHCAGTVEVASLLLDHGADINALDIDHESTPAQYLIADHPEVVRLLVKRGCAPDIFLAAALGDLPMARECIAANPGCVRLRVNSEHFPMKDPRAGGTIYQWTLGFNVSPHEVARKWGQTEILRLLQENSPPEVQLLVSCWTGDASAVQDLLGSDPGLTRRLNAADHRQLADAARNNNLGAVRLMLEAGFPVQTYGQHHATPLHWAAWHGNVDMVKLLLGRNAPLEDADNDFHGSPLAWAVHGSENGWHRQTGNYTGVVQSLLAAGARIPNRTDGTAEVKEALESARRSL